MKPILSSTIAIEEGMEEYITYEWDNYLVYEEYGLWYVSCVDLDGYDDYMTMFVNTEDMREYISNTEWLTVLENSYINNNKTQ